MAANTVSAWAVKSVNSRMIATCTVLADTANTDAYTLKTPDALNPTKPFSMFLVCSATPDAQALPLDLWVGYGSDFALAGTAAPTATSGALFKQIFDDVVLAVTPLVYAFHFDPDLKVADVVAVSAIATGPKVKVPVVPSYVFNLNGGSTLAAATATYVIVQ
jgi:hypothetical protein